MNYDLEMIKELCRELGLRVVTRSADRVAVDLEEGPVLIFVNAEEQEDSRVGFEGMSWHYHGKLICTDRHGNYIELGYLDVLTGLVDGKVLLCELWGEGKLQDCWLVHRDFIDEFGYLRAGEEVRVRRVSSQGGVPGN